MNRTGARDSLKRRDLQDFSRGSDVGGKCSYSFLFDGWASCTERKFLSSRCELHETCDWKILMI